MAQNTTSSNAAYLVDPNDSEPVDEVLIRILQEQRAQAQEDRQAHACELDVQTELHQGAMNRLTRVIAACEAALQQLEPEEQASSGTTITETMQQQAHAKGSALGVTRY